MALPLTETERAQIRQYTGWQFRYRQTDSGLEMAMTALDSSGEAATYTLVASYLTKLIAIDAELDAAHARLAVLEVGSIKLPGEGEIVALRSEGRRWAGRLASLFGVTIRHDVFGGYGPHGGSSNLPPRG